MSRKSLNFSEKYLIVKEKERNPSITIEALAKKYGCGKSTISEILKKQKNQIVEQFSNGQLRNSAKRFVTVKFDDIEKFLLNWCTAAFHSNLEGVTGQLLVFKAQAIAKELQYGESDVNKLNIDWINRFKKRHAIVCSRRIGEAGSVTPEMTSNWMHVTLPKLREAYADEDLYNLDETALYWRVLPEKSLNFKGEKCYGSKKSKDRITVLVGTNATGKHKLPLLVIGKAAHPRCFKGVRSLPVKNYESNGKAWMTSAIFVNYVRQLDKTFFTERRKVCFIIDNCPSHPTIPDLTNIEIIFLPKNTTSVLQPMDGGVIRMLKAYYRRRLVESRIIAFDSKTEMHLDLLVALRFLKSSWDEINSTHIHNCYRHCGFKNSQLSNETENEMITVENIFSGTWERLQEALNISADITAMDYVDLDKAIDTGATLENFVVEKCTTDDQCKSEETHCEEPQPIIPTHSSCLQAIDSIRQLMQTYDNEAQMHNLQQLEDFIKKKMFQTQKQSKITDFF